MKILSLFLTIAVALISTGCQRATSVEIHNNSVIKTQSGAPVSTIAPEFQIDPANFSVTMGRTACKGKCPVYTLSIKSDGKVTFQGETNTAAKQGEDTLAKEKLDELVAALKAAKLSALRDDYTEKSGNCPDFATDNPSVILTVESKDQKKTIQNNLGCIKRSEFVAYPTDLVELEKKIDKIAGTERWIGSQH